MSEIKKGSTVVVVKEKPLVKQEQYYVWVKGMDELVGQKFEVEAVLSDGQCHLVGVDDFGFMPWWLIGVEVCRA
jgi:hypothetical protein